MQLARQESSIGHWRDASTIQSPLPECWERTFPPMSPQSNAPKMNASPEDRKLVHTRSITCLAYERSDGLLDIEGTLVDTKPHEFALPERGRIEAGEPVHQMSIRLTIGRDLLIHDVVAQMVHTPYAVCGAINQTYRQLVGAKIGPGFIQLTKQLFRGRAGCSHLTELLPSIATTAFQVLWGEPSQALKEALQVGGKSPFDGCHALRSDGDVVRIHFPDFYQEPAEAQAD